jgi:hypothetical protein
MIEKSTNLAPANYSTHAIEYIRQWVHDTPALRAERHTAARLLTVAELLKQAVKFVLPNCAEIVDEHSLRETHLDLLRLPYPLVAFEASWVKEKQDRAQINGFEQSTSTRRIALCWELSDDFDPFPGLNLTMREFEGGGVFVLPVYYSDADRVWVVAAGGIFIPRESRLQDNFEPLPGTVIMERALLDAGLAKDNGYRFRAEPFVLIPGMFEALVHHANGDRVKATAQVSLDARDEVFMAIQACSALNCANVETGDVPPVAALNAKRAASGKVPFFTYKVLQLAPGGHVAATAGDGTHASPRMHLRRGHLRRLPNKTIWVRAAMVNSGSVGGVVIKDYAVRPAAHKTTP